VHWLAQAYGVEINIKHMVISLPTQNNPQAAHFAQQVAQDLFGSSQVQTDFSPIMASEDFSFMLDKVPGCYALMSNGENQANVHSSKYDFNDHLIPIMATYFSKLVETYLS
ncbi:M20/M25/M40 family metallo-hydrolase, partial [Lactobacillus sp. XV13L]|nr:M20/M25/M40 family metallo-hydrolase [Lactobacillus sp. XV13L]